MVAVTHSEVLLVSAGSGLLYSWPCEEGVVSAKPHPLNAELGLKGERVTLLTSSEIRVSMVTESGKVATFYDPLLRSENLFKYYKTLVLRCPASTSNPLWGVARHCLVLRCPASTSEPLWGS